MSKRSLYLLAAAGVVSLALASADGVRALQPPPAATPPEPSAVIDAEASLRKLAADYVSAFNKGDAKAAAALWTHNGEYIGADGVIVRGRDDIEKSFIEQFKIQPRALLEVKTTAHRALGTRAVRAEGECLLTVPGQRVPLETLFTALFVREDSGWRIASVHENIPNPAVNVTPRNLEWLLGEWVARGNGKELRTRYRWDDSKTFLHENYTLTKDGKTLASGTQIIGRNPAGGLRAWLFDQSGTTGESFWTRDGERWVIEAASVLPDGTSITAVNLLVPIDANTFTWQSTARTAAGVELPNTPPTKVTRVKTGG